MSGGLLYGTHVLVSGPDPRKNWKEGLGDRLGRKCTMRPACRHTSDWFIKGSAGERSCWSIAELLLGPRISSRSKVGMN